MIESAFKLTTECTNYRGGCYRCKGWMLYCWVRGYSELQVLTGYLRPGRESDRRLPTRKRSLKSGYAADEHEICPKYVQWVFVSSRTKQLGLSLCDTCTYSHHSSFTGPLPVPGSCQGSSSSALDVFSACVFLPLDRRVFTLSPCLGLCPKIPFPMRLTLTTQFIIKILHVSLHLFLFLVSSIYHLLTYYIIYTLLYTLFIRLNVYYLSLFTRI